MYTAAAYIFATDTFCAALGATPDEARADLARVIEQRAVPADAFEGEEPRFALVDNFNAPRSWESVGTFYRIRNAAMSHDTADAYHVGDEAPFYGDLDEAISDAEALDEAGFDTEVVAFDSPSDSGRVVWGA